MLIYLQSGTTWIVLLYIFQLKHKTSTCLLLDISLHVLEHDNQTKSLKELLRDSDYSLRLPASVSHATIVLRHDAVVSQRGELVDIGCFV